MTTINWADGRWITLFSGDEATCDFQLSPGQLYAVVLFNAAVSPQTALSASVKYLAGQEPVAIALAPRAASHGLATLCFVSGSQTQSLQLFMGPCAEGDAANAFLASVSMPTNTVGLTNRPLATNGTAQPFDAHTRLYGVLNMHSYAGKYASADPANLFLRCEENSATVTCLSSAEDPPPALYFAGQTQALVTVECVIGTSDGFSVPGNNLQTVFFNMGSATSGTTLTLTANPQSQPKPKAKAKAAKR